MTISSLTTMKTLLSAFLILFTMQPSLVSATTDSRFFGNYCGDARFDYCVRVRVCFFLGWPCVTRRRCDTLNVDDILVNVKYTEPNPHVGLVEGNGSARASGKNFVLNFGGVVSSHGVAKGSVASNYFNSNQGTARLSSDGLALTIYARGRSLTVRKDQCGNDPPEVAISSPSQGASLPYGGTNVFSGMVTADEDANFPEDRLVFRSNRDGMIKGYVTHGVRNISVFNNTLSPGNHVVSFTATDSGGLSTSSSVSVSVTNKNPKPPTIIQPLSADTIVATGDIIFEGKTYDLEDGILDSGSLVWSASHDGGPFNKLGSGRKLRQSLNTPGSYIVRLTATDSVGGTSFTNQAITVLPYTGNTVPRVTIDTPKHIEWLGMAVLTGETMEFIGSAEDDEDPITDLDLKWEAEAINPAASPVVFGTGATNASITLNAVGAQTTQYKITFSATDIGGLTAKKIIRLTVMSQPLL